MRVAVIGAGNMGRHHIRIWSEMANSGEDIEFVGIADPMPGSKTLADQYKTKHYFDYKQLIKRQKPDIVSLVVPTRFHKDIAMDLISRGINVLIEKPIASTIEEAQEIIKATDQSNCIVMIGHIEWFNPAVQKLKELIDNGTLGDSYIILTERFGNKTQEGDINIVLDIGVHDIHVICKLVGEEPNYIFANGGCHWFSKLEDFAVVTMEFGPITATAQLCWFFPNKTRRLRVIGTKGCAELDYNQQKLRFYPLSEGIELTGFNSYSDFLLKSSDFGTEGIPVRVEKQEPLRLELEAFLKACRGEIANPIPPEEATMALDICLQATKLIQLD